MAGRKSKVTAATPTADIVEEAAPQEAAPQEVAPEPELVATLGAYRVLKVQSAGQQVSGRLVLGKHDMTNELTQAGADTSVEHLLKLAAQLRQTSRIAIARGKLTPGTMKYLGEMIAKNRPLPVQ